MTLNLNKELRKAAILIQSLDPRSANMLLMQLNRATAQKVIEVQSRLGEIPSHEKEHVLSEFLETVQLVSKDSCTTPFSSENSGGV